MPKVEELKCYFGCVLDGSLHRFCKWEYPNEERFDKWKSVLDTATQDRGNSYIYNNVRICHRHFENYYKSPARRLTKNAIPTLNLTLPQTQKQPSLPEPVHQLGIEPNVTNGPVFECGSCRCCGETKRCRLLTAEYCWRGSKEVYADMLLDCFGLVLSNLEGEETERLICATCVARLREAGSFYRQVLRCEERLLQATIHLHTDGADAASVKCEDGVKDEKQVAAETELDNHDGDHMDYDSDIPEVKGEQEQKGIKTLKKRRKKEGKRGVKRKKKDVLDEDTMAKNQMLQDMEKMYNRLTEIQTIRSEKRLQKSSESRESDKTQKSNHNLNILVEYSYACPFDTSFSDYFCSYCRDKFTDPDKLRDHTMTHDPKDFGLVLKNTNMTKKLQVDVYRIDCRLCTERINDVETFKKHVSSHGKEVHSVADEFLKFRLTQNLSCMECGATFSFFHALKKHMAEHFGTCICDVCGAHYFEERMLLLHQKTHQRVEESYSCKDCGKSFKSKYTRYIHIARMHKNEAAYPCNKCDELFFSYMRRYRHMMEAHGEERVFRCEVCSREYDSRKSLREHTRRLHQRVMRHACELCDRRFYLPCRLREHMATHTGERNYRCECCGKSFPRLRGLKVHMQSHSSDKKYKCVMCNASFTQNVNLKNHMKRQHLSLVATQMDESYHE